jgi:hypothetical protein
VAPALHQHLTERDPGRARRRVIAAVGPQLERLGPLQRRRGLLELTARRVHPADAVVQRHRLEHRQLAQPLDHRLGPPRPRQRVLVAAELDADVIDEQRPRLGPHLIGARRLRREVRLLERRDRLVRRRVVVAADASRPQLRLRQQAAVAEPLRAHDRRRRQPPARLDIRARLERPHAREVLAHLGDRRRQLRRAPLLRTRGQLRRLRAADQPRQGVQRRQGLPVDLGPAAGQRRDRLIEVRQRLAQALARRPAQPRVGQRRRVAGPGLRVAPRVGVRVEAREHQLARRPRVRGLAAAELGPQLGPPRRAPHRVDPPLARTHLARAERSPRRRADDRHRAGRRQPPSPAPPRLERAQQRRHVRVALLGPRSQPAIDRRVHAARQTPRPTLPRLARESAVQRLAQRQTKRVLIRRRSQRPADALLRRHVPRRPCASRRPALAHPRPRDRGRVLLWIDHEPEVGDPRPPVLADQHVVGLEVAVHEALGVGRRQPAPGLHEHRKDLRPPASRRQPAAQRAAGHVLHRDVNLLRRRAHVVHRDHVRVHQRRHRPGLAQQQLRVALARAAQAQLERHLPVQRLVPRQVHHPHAAAPEHPHDHEGPVDDAARRQRGPVAELVQRDRWRVGDRPQLRREAAGVLGRRLGPRLVHARQLGREHCTNHDRCRSPRATVRQRPPGQPDPVAARAADRARASAAIPAGDARSIRGSRKLSMDSRHRRQPPPMATTWGFRPPLCQHMRRPVHETAPADRLGRGARRLKPAHVETTGLDLGLGLHITLLSGCGDIHDPRPV